MPERCRDASASFHHRRENPRPPRRAHPAGDPAGRRGAWRAPAATRSAPIRWPEIEHRLGLWALRFLMLALAVTPLRQLTGKPVLVRFRRMLGLYAFFYASAFRRLPRPRPARLLDPGLRGHRQAPVHHRRFRRVAAGCRWRSPRPPAGSAGSAATGAPAQAGLRHRRARRAAFLVAGEIRHPRTGAVRRHPAALLGWRAWKAWAARRKAALSRPRTTAAG